MFSHLPILANLDELFQDYRNTKKNHDSKIDCIGYRHWAECVPALVGAWKYLLYIPAVTEM